MAPTDATAKEIFEELKLGLGVAHPPILSAKPVVNGMNGLFAGNRHVVHPGAAGQPEEILAHQPPGAKPVVVKIAPLPA